MYDRLYIGAFEGEPIAMPIRGDDCAVASGDGDDKKDTSFSGSRGEGVGKLKVSLPALKSILLCGASISSVESSSSATLESSKLLRDPGDVGFSSLLIGVAAAKWKMDFRLETARLTVVDPSRSVSDSKPLSPCTFGSFARWDFDLSRNPMLLSRRERSVK